MTESERDPKSAAETANELVTELSLEQLEQVRGGALQFAVRPIASALVNASILRAAPVGLGASNGSFIKSRGPTIRISR